MNIELAGGHINIKITARSIQDLRPNEHPGAEVADTRGCQWRSLDRAATRQAAHFDSTEFVANEDLMVIDEIQRVPELLLAIKESVDNDPRPGRFLLTGSARLLSMRAVPDALPGRMETVELWPLSQGEIDDKPDRFVDAAFALGPDLRHDSGETRSGYNDFVRVRRPELRRCQERRSSPSAPQPRLPGARSPQQMTP
jgi:AAA domain